MKTLLRSFPALILLTLAPGLAFAEPEVRLEIKALEGADPARVVAMKKVAYLGVATAPPPAVLRAQLDLPAGVGLVLEHVAPDSPAAGAGLKEMDVLHKLDDQILINLEQLTTLVRAKKPGDQVQVSFIRAGKPSVVAVKLSEQEVPAVEVIRPQGGPNDRPEAWRFDLPDVRIWQFGNADGNVMKMRQEILDQQRKSLELMKEQIGQEQMDQILKLLEQRFGGFLGEGVIPLKPGAQGQVDVHSLVTASATLNDGEHTLSLTVNNNKGKHLKATDQAGQVIFEGPINTPEERNKVPAPILEKLGKLENQTKFDFRINRQPLPEQPPKQPPKEPRRAA